jgi:hypothetical protein
VVVRLLLALALLATAVAAVLASRALRVGEGALFAPGSAGVVVLDLSSSTEAAPPEQIQQALRRVAASGRHAGLVLFSDVAYAALPPEAKGVELRAVMRYFRAPREAERFRPTLRQRRRQATPWSSFRGGTRISAGLRMAESLLGASARRGVVLISDLNDSLFDLPQLTRVLRDYHRRGIRIRVVALDPTPDDRAFWERQVGRAAFVSDAALTAPTSVRRTELAGSFPTTLVALAVVLALALAANELWSARLSWSPDS